MLIPNPLYYFIQFIAEKGSTDLKGIHFQKNTDLQKHSYYLHQLALSTEAIQEYQHLGYTLDEHHVSFYEAQDNNKFWLSQYHYTATVTDEEKQELKLHVYLSPKETIEELMLMKVNVNNTYDKQAIIQGHRDWFEGFAMQYSLPLILRLRQAFQTNLKSLENRYEVLEKELSILSQKKHGESYQNKLFEMRKTLHLLYPLNPSYLPIYQNFFQARPRRILTKPLNEEQKSLPAAPVIETEAVEPLATLEISHTEDQAFLALLEKAKEAKAIYQKDKAAKPLVEQVPSLFNFYDICVQSNIFLDEQIEISETNLQTIQNLYCESRSEAKNTFTLLLLQGDLQAAFVLKGFTAELPLSIIQFAITKRKADLLDFLLSHGQYAINSLQVDNLQVIHYCLLHQADAKILGVFSVLVKHGISLTIKTEEGLPVAHAILNSSLKGALEADSKSTLSNPSFYTRLCFGITRYLQGANIDEKKAKKLKASLDAYQKTKSTLKNWSNDEKSRDRFMQSSTSMTANLLKTFQANQSQSLVNLNEEECREKYKRFEKASQDLIKNMSSPEKAKSIRFIEEMNRQMTSNPGETMQLSEADSEKRLEKVEDFIQFIEIYAKKIELQALFKTIGRSPKQKKASKSCADQINDLENNLTMIRIKWALDGIPENERPLNILNLSTATVSDIAKSFPSLLDKIQALSKSKNKSPIQENKSARETEIQDIKFHLENQLETEKARQLFQFTYHLIENTVNRNALKALAEFKPFELTVLFINYINTNGNATLNIEDGDRLITIQLSAPISSSLSISHSIFSQTTGGNDYLSGQVSLKINHSKNVKTLQKTAGLSIN